MCSIICLQKKKKSCRDLVDDNNENCTSHKAFKDFFPQYSNIDEQRRKNQEQAVWIDFRVKWSWSQATGAVLFYDIAFFSVVNNIYVKFIPEQHQNIPLSVFSFLPQSLILLQDCTEKIPVFIVSFQFISLRFPLLSFSSHCHCSVLAAVPLPWRDHNNSPSLSEHITARGMLI